MSKTLGTFTLIKNELPWIGFHVMSLKDVVSEFVFYDASTDGTTALLEYLRDKKGLPIRLFRDKDPKDLKDSYVEMFNECLGQVRSDYAWFCHPDMILVSGESKVSDAPAYYINLESFAGEPGKQLYRIASGRNTKWKSIMLNSFSLHYHGHYGASDEDMYFRDITGNNYKVFRNPENYPYRVNDSGLNLFHYSDVRPYHRRVSRMTSILVNDTPGISREDAHKMASVHPRVTLKSGVKYGIKFDFEEVKDYPRVFDEYADEFASVIGRPKEEWMYIQGGLVDA